MYLCFASLVRKPYSVCSLSFKAVCEECGGVKLYWK